MTPGPISQTARRPAWDTVPTSVRRAIDEACGSPVVRADSQGRGFTPGVAVRLELADGRRVFVKAASTRASSWVASSYRAEAEVVRSLPVEIGVPRVQWTIEPDEWFAVGFDDVEGRHPRRPWTSDDLGPVVRALEETAAALTPVPDSLAAPDIREVHDGYLALLEEVDVPEIAELRTLARRFHAAPFPPAAIHGDIRDDNLLIDTTGRVLVVDWNYLSTAPAWLDLVGLLTSVHGDGVDADAVLRSSPLTSVVDPDLVDGYLALLLGYFTHAAAQDELESSPSLRTHQAWYRDATWSWLRTRRGWSRHEPAPN